MSAAPSSSPSSPAAPATQPTVAATTTPAPATQLAVVSIPVVLPTTQDAGDLTPLGPSRSTWMGTNISANDPWTTTAAWCDVAHQMTGWYPPSGAKLGYTDDGYPTGPALCHCWLHAYPSGVYRVHYKAAKNFYVSAHPIQKLHSVGDGAMEGEVSLKAEDYVEFRVDGPVSDVHLYAPDARPGQTFRDAYLDYLKPYSVVRLMNWGKVNNGWQSPPPPTHWAGRVTPQNFDQTTRGVALEYQAELCKEAGAQPWVCLPYGADDDYITHAAQCFTGFKTVRVEYCNELWNTTLGPQGMQCRNDADAATYGAGDINQRGARRAAALTAHAGAIFRQVLGADHVKVVFGAQAAWNAWAADGLAYSNPPDRAQGRPADIDVLAVAPYFQPADNLTSPTADAMLASCDKWITTVLEPGLKSNKQVADKYGAAYEAYEGGQSLIRVNPRAHPQGNPALWAADPATQAQNHPRMGDLYDRLFAVSKSNGITLFCHYLVVGDWGPSGYWGLYQYTGDPGGVKAAAVRRAMEK